MGSKTTQDPIDLHCQKTFFSKYAPLKKEIHTQHYTIEDMPYYEYLCRNNIWHFEIKVIAAMTALPLKGITVKMKQ